MATTHSVKDLQGRFGVGEHTILQWIRSGDLKAINVARGIGRRPKWRVTAEALAAFELARESGTQPSKAVRRKRATSTVITYY